jgi:hypothetical protein
MQCGSFCQLANFRKCHQSKLNFVGAEFENSKTSVFANAEFPLVKNRVKDDRGY